ncbi:hypothetical protein WR25_18178 [Diploscapter pachys]|uniref:eIF-4F 25 kDa subunit n=1 Tax=Diploscapter pachys TaxID=2018661 RepID=A0A2A2JI57_9BILA|nr:hypothetical protein WR25_18178 [Diploscapter pachys]
MSSLDEQETGSDETKQAKVQPMFVTETSCCPGEHPLQFTYVYSYFVKPQGKFDPEEYAQYVQPIAAVNSVEQFWNVYRHLKMPCEFQEKIDIHFFKKGIKPVWEDESNVKGGKWILRLKKGFASRIWENLILAMIGEQFLVGEEICGAVCSVRNQEDIVSLWNKTADSIPVTNRIRDTLRRVLQLPPIAVLEYKKHDDCLRDQSSYRHTNLDVIGGNRRAPFHSQVSQPPPSP